LLAATDRREKFTVALRIINVDIYIPI